MPTVDTRSRKNQGKSNSRRPTFDLCCFIACIYLGFFSNCDDSYITGLAFYWLVIYCLASKDWMMALPHQSRSRTHVCHGPRIGAIWWMAKNYFISISTMWNVEWNVELSAVGARIGWNVIVLYRSKAQSKSFIIILASLGRLRSGFVATKVLCLPFGFVGDLVETNRTGCGKLMPFVAGQMPRPFCFRYFI